MVVASDELLLIDLLKNTFRKYLDVDIKIDADVVKSRDSFGLPDNSIRDIPTEGFILSKKEQGRC